MARKLPFRSMSAEVMPGAEAWSVTGGPVGALVLHGLGGTPATVRPVGDALARAGLSVAVPRLPGHGTVIDDLVPTRFADWSVAAGHALEELAASCAEVVVVGQSMGATLACGLAARHPEVTGLVAVNPLVRPVDAELVALVRLMFASGDVVADGDGPDLADRRATELSYRGTPLAAVLSLYEALVDLQVDLARIACPLLLMTSATDHVVDPANSDHLAASVAGPVERVVLARSYHVATLDHDKDIVAQRTVDFVARVTTKSRGGQDGERRRRPGRPS